MLKWVDRFLDSVIAGLKKDAEGKQQKIPQNFRKEVTETSGKLWGASYFKYLVYGRPPGKQPPTSSIEGWVNKNPQVLAYFKSIFKNITSKQLSYVIARNIGRHGTQIWQGKKPGVDMSGVVDNSLKELFTNLPKSYGAEIITNLRNAINK
jgi:hypothetical protein